MGRKKTSCVFAKEKEMAIKLNCGLFVLRGKTLGGKPTLMIWKPKADNPYVNYSFQDDDRLEKYLEGQVSSFMAYQKMKEDRKAARKGSPELMAQVQVGSIFDYSWGYDQTNVDFYEVIEVKGQRVLVQEIGQQSVEGSGGLMSDSRLPVKGRFLANSNREWKVVQFSNGKPYLSKPYGWCGLWDGKAQYCSWYA